MIVASHLLRLLGCLIGGIYASIPFFWMLVHPFVHRWRAARVKFKWLGAWWVLLWIVAWAAGYPWRELTVYTLLAARGVDVHLTAPLDRIPGPPFWIFALPFWLASLYLYSKGGTGLSLERVIGSHEVDAHRTPDRLVTEGIYARTRNPIYLGHACTLLGWCFATQTVVCWGYFAFYVVTLLIMLPMEERELRQRFGAEYEDYCRRVPRLIPKF